jgi:TolA-binding protein
MKRTERRHLKENDFELWTRDAREFLETRGRETLTVLVAAIVIGGAALGYYGWRQHVQSRSSAMLAEAVAIQTAQTGDAFAPGVAVPPGGFPNETARDEAAVTKLKAAADAYPSTDAGIYARYEQAATLVSLGRYAEAIDCYNEAIKRAGSGNYAQMARLGVAEAKARAGQYDEAINALKDLAQHKEGALPIDGILIELGRVYLEAGKTADARQTFNRVVDEFPDSPYVGEAQQRLSELGKS